MKLKSLEELGTLLPDTFSQKNSDSDSRNKHDGKGRSVRVILETAGRKGKSVTLIKDLQHNPQTMEEIAKILKQHCGAGGTIKNGCIEIQGDQRDKIIEKLRSMNYTLTIKS